MNPYSTTISRPLVLARRWTIEYYGSTLCSVLRSFCLGMVRRRRLVARPSWELNNALSHDHRRTIFPLAIAKFPYTEHLCIIPRNHIHTLQLCFSRARHRNVQEGMSPVVSSPASGLGRSWMVQVPNVQRTRWSMLCLASLSCLLTLSTFVHLPEGVFAAFIIMAGIALAATGSYLQTSVIAVASLFGPAVIQSLMSGQAIVAVILSAVQLIGATGSLHSSQAGPADGVAERRSARLFFGIAMTFLFVCGAANAWMARLPSYRAIVPHDEPWIRRRLSVSVDPRSPRSPTLLLGNRHTGVSDSKVMWDRILSLGRRNILYELAVAYVFVITLVSCRASLFKMHSMTDVIWHYSLSFPPSRYQLPPPTQRYTHSFSVHYIS